MPALGFPLAGALGGPGLSAGRPWIINRLPTDDAQNVKLLRPICFTARDAETFIDRETLYLKVGYAKVRSNGLTSFDDLPRTVRGSLLARSFMSEPHIEVGGGGLSIEKTSGDPQRSLWYTPIEGEDSSPNFLVTAMLRPDVVSEATLYTTTGPLNNSVYPGPLLPTPYANVSVPVTVGPVIGIENNRRRKAAYLFFDRVDGQKVIFLTGALQSPAPIPALSVTYDWDDFQRYILLWNEWEGYVEAYVTVDSVVQVLFKVPISSFGEYPEDFQTKGTSKDIVGVYGIEGAAGTKATWRNIAVTADVGFPILGAALSGDFNTTIQSSQFLRLDGDVDPREKLIAPWFNTPASIIGERDVDGTLTIAEPVRKLKVVRLTKKNLNKTFSIFREEPGFLHSPENGMLVEVKMVPKLSNSSEGIELGCGLVIYDGETVYVVSFFELKENRLVGILKQGGNPEVFQDYVVARYDWTTASGIRFVADRRQGKVRIYSMDNLVTPIVDQPWDRAKYPDAAEFGLDADTTPFLAVGNTIPAPTTGFVDVHYLSYCHLYQAWEGSSGKRPEEVGTNPIYTKVEVGSPSTPLLVGDTRVKLETAAGKKLYYRRDALFEPERGAGMEADLEIKTYRTRSGTGVYLILDDGAKSYMLTFVETDLGRFVCVPVKSGSGFKELAGPEREDAKYSFPFDWTKRHLYRIERRVFADGFYVFVDNEPTPRLAVSDRSAEAMPDSQFPGTPTVAFGHYTDKGAVSLWGASRLFFSAGYEFQVKKNRPDSVLRDELYDAEAVVIAYAKDEDT